MMHDIYEKVIHKNVASFSLHTLLNNKYFTEKIHPRRIYLLLNIVRKMATSQLNEIIELKAAKIVVDYLYDITNWYISQLKKGAVLSTSAFTGVEAEVTLQPRFTLDDMESGGLKAAN